MANDSYMKQRSGLQAGNYNDMEGQLERRKFQSGGSARRGIATGTFDRFYPHETACWIHISPTFFSYEIYDRDQREVVAVETTWLETIQHYVPKKKQSFVCSSGPHMDKPCWGCATTRAHYEKLDRIKEQQGFRPDEKPPIGKSSQFSLAITVMEPIYEIPLMEKDGSTPRKSKSGQKIYRYVPGPFMDDDFMERYTPTFGRRMHWSMGQENLNQLISSAGPQLKHHCLNCADSMFATALICPNCETTRELPDLLDGEDLVLAATKERVCTTCKESAAFVPVYGCACESPKSGGSLLSFDIRVKRTKVGDKSSLVSIVGVRTPTHLNKSNPKEVRDSLTDMVENPLNLVDIFSPTPLKMQEAWVGSDLIEGLSPEPRKSKSTETEDYNDKIDYDSNE